MATRWAVTGGTWSSTSTWNNGATLGIPTSSDDVFSNGFTVTMNVNSTVNSLNNSARARDIATPQMTANNAPSPYVAAASTVFAAGQEAYRAFDRNYSTSTYWTSNGLPSWLSFDFGSSIIIDGYTIYGSNSVNDNPRNWTFEGSNNNTSWNILHTVTSATAIPAGGTYSIFSIGNPTAYRYYRVNVSNNGASSNTRITELELYQPGTAALAAGGSFNFNTAGVSVTCTSTSSSLSIGATNLITITATGGTVTLNLASTVTALATVGTQMFNHTGNCDLILNGIRFNGGNASGTAFCINKTSTGTITIIGDMFGGGNGGTAYALNSIAGNTVVVGNVNGNSTLASINQTAGNITITGNVQGNTSGTRGVILNNVSSILIINGNLFGGFNVNAEAVFITSAASVLINGDVYAAASNGLITTAPTTINGNIYGAAAVGVSTTAPLIINGSVFARATAGISTTSAIAITVSGDVYASSTSVGISSTNTNSNVNLTGNMYNTLGRMAIWCPNVFISNSATTLWRMDIGGGLTRTLYSADSFPNLPPTSDVRNLIQYGPASGLTGTMIVASPSDIRVNVLTDNTVGAANITAQDILNFINTSSDPLAVRMRTMLTDNSAGQLISEYNFV